MEDSYLLASKCLRGHQNSRQTYKPKQTMVSFGFMKAKGKITQKKERGIQTKGTHTRKLN